ncbi:MAG TPA: hypothetical protein VGX48_00645 [Pyrinomonadaceae bacterium]|jgi:predicted Zn-dependent protease|nr:hypothetical protein [Pyrinomonadaceae bacterium]
MSERNLQVLTSRGFVASLALLLVNDFLLKPLLHNALTGKLSDFAGLFVFPLFWSALFPRFRRHVYVTTAALFLFWKSAHSQPLVEAWNSLRLIPLGRTVDATDLVALLVLPVSYFYSQRSPDAVPPRRLATGLLACVSIFAFAATSYRTKFDYDRKYAFDDSKTVLVRKIHHLRHLGRDYQIACRGGLDSVQLQIPAKLCFNSVDAVVSVGEEGGRSVIRLKEMEHDCPESKGDKQKLLDIFEQDFVAPLSQLTLPAAADDAPAPEAKKAPPKAEGRLYMVALGEVPGVSVEKLAEHFGRKYGVEIKVLRKLSLGEESRDPKFPGSKPEAARLLNYARREYPKAAAEPGAVLIGVTADMYVGQILGQTAPDYEAFFHREEGFAVVSASGLDPATYCEPPDPQLLAARLRKTIARAIGTIYFRLPRSDDPRSVLHNDLGCVDELDAAGEDF